MPVTDEVLSEVPDSFATKVPLAQRTDLPPAVARTIRERVTTRAWTAKDAAVIADFCGFVPEEEFPGSSTTPWRGRCARSGHSCSPRLQSLLVGQGCCLECGHELRGVAQTLRNIAECVEIARLRGAAVTAYTLRQEGPKRRLYLRIRWDSCGHTSEMGTNHFRGGMRGCALCRGLQVIPGINDLATTHPHLARQLVDPDIATRVTFGSGRRLEWECPQCLYVWRTTVTTRSGYKTGCPRCSKSRMKLGMPTVLYFLRGESTRSGVRILKVGISNVGQPWEARQRAHRRAGLTEDLHPPIIFGRTEEAVLIEGLWCQYVRELPASARVTKSDAPNTDETVRDTRRVRAWIETLLLPAALLAARASEADTRRGQVRARAQRATDSLPPQPDR